MGDCIPLELQVERETRWESHKVSLHRSLIVKFVIVNASYLLKTSSHIINLEEVDPRMVGHVYILKPVVIHLIGGSWEGRRI